MMKQFTLTFNAYPNKDGLDEIQYDLSIIAPDEPYARYLAGILFAALVADGWEYDLFDVREVQPPFSPPSVS